MTSQTRTRAISAALVGALGLTSMAAFAPPGPARAAQPAAQQQNASRLWPTISPATNASVPLRIVADISARAPIARVQVLVDGKAVRHSPVRYDATHHRVIYTPGTLAPGSHVVRVATWDKAGFYSWRWWTLAVPATATAPSQPDLRADQARVRAGSTVTVSGQGFKPGIRVSVSVGGVNTGAGGNYGSAVVDRAGRFSLPVTLTAYPDGPALKPGTVVLLAHGDPSSPAAESQKATVQLQIVR